MRASVCVIAVAATALAFLLCAGIEWPWVLLEWVALVPWLAALDRTTSWRGALAAGLLMSEAFVAAVFHWFPEAIRNYTGAPWAVALLVVVAVAPVIEPQFIAFVLARHLARRAPLWYRALAAAAVYVGAEWLCPKLFADTIGHGLYASTLMRQAADIAGAHGLTFVLIIANECVLAVLRSSPPFSKGGLRGILLARRQPSVEQIPPAPPSLKGGTFRQALAPAACVAALVLALLAYGAVRLQQLGGDGRAAGQVTAGLVQADISHYEKLKADMGTFDAVRMILDTHFALSTELLRRGDLDLLVWPETVYPTTFGAPKSEDGAAFDREISAFVNHTRVPLVFGAYDAEGDDEFNAAVFLEPTNDGRLTFDMYRKASLFPFTERVPSLFESDGVRHWLPWLGTWKPGTGPQVLPLTLRDGRTLLVAPLICYDTLDPRHALAAVRRGAEMIVTLSNDSWFSYDGVPRLILVITAFRSLETRRPQVRATNTGISAVITATGELLGTIGVDERSILVGTVTPERHAMTLMLAWGDWFGPAALACGVALLVVSLLKR